MVDGPTIVVTKRGPYLVSGSVPLQIQVIAVNEHGNGIEWSPGRSYDVPARYALCRCGRSNAKPFCDGAHADSPAPSCDPSAASTELPPANVYEGPTLRLVDNVPLCAFARFCDAVNIWSAMPTSDQPEVRKTVVREALQCPSARLVLYDKATGAAIEEQTEISIGLVEDPAIGCSGPLWVRGAVSIERPDGRRYDTRSRATLCRCGATANPPFCDGGHSTVGFKDGILDSV